MLNFFFLTNEAIICKYANRANELTNKLTALLQMAFLPGTRAFENSVAVESCLLVNTEFPSVIVTIFTNIKQTLHKALSSAGLV